MSKPVTIQGHPIVVPEDLLNRAIEDLKGTVLTIHCGLESDMKHSEQLLVYLLKEFGVSLV